MVGKSQKLTRSKALIATAFATSILSSPLPAIADDQHSTKATSAQQHILDDKTGTPYTKAFVLLRLADSYLTFSDPKTAEKGFLDAEHPVGNWRRDLHGRYDKVGAWSNQLSRLSQSDTAPIHQRKIANRNSFDEVLKEALKEIELIQNQYQKLRLYYISSLLFKKAGDAKQYEKINAILQEQFSACEDSPNIDTEQIRGAVAVLNSMSFGVISLVIPDARTTPTAANFYSAPVFLAPLENAESLRLRAIAIADRLPASSDIRRRAHRDMAIWYLQLGKNELADNQKESLFELVGFKDDGLLYPQNGMCGTLVWWERPIKNNADELCGMG